MGKNSDRHSTPRYSEGVRDGRKGTYNPPGKGNLRIMLEGISEKELRDKREYEQGIKHGKKDRK